MAGEALHRVLVVGVGSIGERHARCFLATGRCEVAVVEVNHALRQIICERYGVRGYVSLAEAVAADSHTAAVICTPAHLHLPMARELAAAGLHLLIEKPLSTSLDQLRELAEEITARGLTCGVAYVYRSHPVLAAMREAIHSGRFGKPVQLTAVCGQHFPTYRPAYREIYYNNRATGGGAIQDALTHILNAGEWLVGPDHHASSPTPPIKCCPASPWKTPYTCSRGMARCSPVIASTSIRPPTRPRSLSFASVEPRDLRGTTCAGAGKPHPAIPGPRKRSRR
jgi:predicted dehydrogenase